MQLVQIARRPHNVHAGRREHDTELTEGARILVIAVQNGHEDDRKKAQAEKNQGPPEKSAHDALDAAAQFSAYRELELALAIRRDPRKNAAVEDETRSATRCTYDS